MNQRSRADSFDRVMSRLRVLGALVILTMTVAVRITSSHPKASLGLGLLATAGLFAMNVVAGFLRPDAASGKELRLTIVVVAQIVGDVGLAILGLVALAVPAGSPASLLLVVPVLEAAVRFRVMGAIMCWAGAFLALLLRAFGSLGEGDTGQLMQSAQLGGVLLAIALPVAYIAEHLVAEVIGTSRSRFVAERRAEVLSVLAFSGRELNALTIEEVHEAIVATTDRMGGLAQDAWVHHNGEWERISEAEAESHRAAHLLLPPVAAPGADEVAWEDGVTITGDRWPFVELRMSAGEEHLLVRVVTDPPWRRLVSEALEVLYAQASVALHNAELHQRMQLLTTELAHRADHDSLTGLANRRRLSSVLDAARTAGTHPGYALLYLDLDGFKPVNDRLGHLAGDELLVIVAKRLKSAAEPNGLVVRLGGDEFAVLAQDDNPQARGEQLKARITAALERPVALGPHVVNIGTSVGLAVIRPNEPFTTNDVMSEADALMYEDKRERKGIKGATPNDRGDDRELRGPAPDRIIGIPGTPSLDPGIPGIPSLDPADI